VAAFVVRARTEPTGLFTRESVQLSIARTASSRIAVPFPGEQRGMLDLADACDVPTRWGCRTGVCHTCITLLLSGDVTYSPDPLEAPADGQVLICCAQPSTDIVLDM
jgi:ferredoxin